jgi:hypothetical protein
MDAGLLKTLGQLLGIGGLALGVFFLLFREVIRKSIFPTLKKDDAYRLLRLITVLIWSVAVIGIAAWLWGNRKEQESSATTTGPQSPVIQHTKGDVKIDFNAPQPAPK